MSSLARDDRRRRDRSWEKEGRGGVSRDLDRERDRRGGGRPRSPRRRSRSRSPPRRADRDYRGERRDPREYERRDDKRPRDGERPRERSREKDRDGYRERDRRERDRDERDRRPDLGDDRSRRDVDRDGRPTKVVSGEQSASSGPSKTSNTPLSRKVDLDPDSAEPEEGEEEGEAMDAVDDEVAAMQVMMGIGGFGTTKGNHVTGNQEGVASVKKMRTWRQYMNRRGGFNRPLDKIK